MEQCRACGASLPEQASWCGQCYAPRTGAPLAPAVAPLTPVPGAVPAAVPAAVPFRSVPPPPVLPPTVRRSRWRKTQTTFGPVGRIVATLCLVLPFLFLVAMGVVGDIMTLAGAVIWGLVLMPWGLRDVWKAGALPGA